MPAPACGASAGRIGRGPDDGLRPAGRHAHRHPGRRPRLGVSLPGRHLALRDGAVHALLLLAAQRVCHQPAERRRVPPHGQLPDTSAAGRAGGLARPHVRLPCRRRPRPGTCRLVRDPRAGLRPRAAHRDVPHGHGSLRLPGVGFARHGHYRHGGRRHGDRAGGRQHHRAPQLRGLCRGRRVLRHPHPLQGLFRCRVRHGRPPLGHLGA